MLIVNLFTNWNIKTRSLNFPEWLVNYSRLLKSNYQWYSGNIIYCLVSKNKFKKCKHVYNEISIISNKFSLMKLLLASCPCFHYPQYCSFLKKRWYFKSLICSFTVSKMSLKGNDAMTLLAFPLTIIYL